MRFVLIDSIQDNGVATVKVSKIFMIQDAFFIATGLFYSLVPNAGDTTERIHDPGMKSQYSIRPTVWPWDFSRPRASWDPRHYYLMNYRY